MVVLSLLRGLLVSHISNFDMTAKKQLSKLSVVAMEKKAGYHIFVNAKVHGKKVRMLIDTGASTTVIDLNWFRKNISKKTEVVKVDTAGLHSVINETHFAKLKDLELAGRKLKKLRVPALDLTHVNNIYAKMKKPKVQGIIGSDVMLEHHALIDYKSLTLSFQR